MEAKSYLRILGGILDDKAAIKHDTPMEPMGKVANELNTPIGKAFFNRPFL
jgi:hypothetical protein